MKVNHRKLVMILIEKLPDWTLGSKLSQLLNVSDRQVRRHINDINQIIPNLIESSNFGYRVSQQNVRKYYEYLNQDKQSVISPSERKEYLLKKILSEKIINLYDFSERIFVSTSTVENDIKKLNNVLKEYKLSLKLKNASITLEGDEIDKRRFIAAQTLKKNIHFNLKSEVELVADYYNVGSLFNDIKDILNDSEIYANDYAISNIVLHVIVMIERLRKRNFLTFSLPDTPFENTPQYNASKKIYSFISEKYKIESNKTELFQLMLVIDNNTSVINFSIVNSDNLIDYVPLEIINLTRNILENLSNQYVLEVYNEEFMVKFTIHLYNLISRYKHKYLIKHPFKDELKKNHPYIYDMAVYIAQLLKDNYMIEISDDEISFIAIHIGGSLQEQVESKNKFKAAFVYSEYYDNYKTALNQLKSTFDHELIISDVVSIKNYMNFNKEVDLVLSTDKIQYDSKVIYIGPFFNENGKLEIEHAIYDLKKKDKARKKEQVYRRFFKKNLYFNGENIEQKEEVIRFISNQAVSKGYVENAFLDDVLKREHLSSTDFTFVAIPHSLSEHVNDSFISIYINAEKIPWGKSNLNLVLLIGVNKDEIEDFAYLYDSLVEILENQVKVLELVSAPNYDKFLEKLIIFQE